MSVALHAYTHADLAEMPDDGNRYEIIGGELVVSPSPLRNHQRVVAELFLALGGHVRAHQLGEVFSAPFDVALTPYDVVQPDLFFISRERTHIGDSGIIRGAPDLVVEVLSSRTRGYDLVKKMAMYATAGVREYWIADPIHRSLTVYMLVQGLYEPVEIVDGVARSLVVSGFAIAVDEVFSTLSADPEV